MPATFSSATRLAWEFSALCHRQARFIGLLAQREILDRFKGSILGAVWAVAHPLASMLLYVLVFGYVMRLRMPAGTIDDHLNYATFFIAGYLPWMTCQDVLLRTCVSITQNHNMVKQVVFPLEVLPLRSLLAGAFPQLVGTVFLIGYLTYLGGLQWSILLLPVALFAQMTMLAGFGFLLSSLTVFLRDIRELLVVFLSMGLYIAPILYVPGMLPGWVDWIFFANPFSHLVWMSQDLWIYGQIQHPASWVLAPLLGVVLLLFGFALFRKLRVFFGNYL